MMCKGDDVALAAPSVGKGTEDASQFSGSNVRHGNTFASRVLFGLREWPA